MTPLARKLRRALFLVPFVAKHPGGVPLAELAAMLDVSPRELARTIEELLTVGVPGGSPADFLDMWLEGSGAAARVFVVPPRMLRRPPRLTHGEALALLLGASALRKGSAGRLDDALSRAETKIRDLARRSGDGDHGGPAAIVIDAGGHERPDVLDILGTLAREKRAVVLDYASLAGQRRKKIEVEPYGLMNHQGAWYVLGRSITHAEDRVFVFKVERILGVTPLDRRFEPPRDFDLRKYAGDRMFVTGLMPVTVELRLAGEAATRLGPWFKNGRKARGGSVTVRFKDHATGWLAAWILRQGPEVQVATPPDLGAWVARMARRVAEQHSEK